MGDIGRILMVGGGALFLVGLVLALGGRLPGLGHLPGDITIQRGNFTLYAPFGTMIVISVVLTLVLNLISRLWR
jgi:hypothetical protein